MGARQKLNGSYFNGSLLVAGMAGAFFQSWLVFFTALFTMLGLNLYLQEIRPSTRDRRGQNVQ
jgi:hypothetical protein